MDVTVFISADDALVSFVSYTLIDNGSYMRGAISGVSQTSDFLKDVADNFSDTQPEGVEGITLVAALDTDPQETGVWYSKIRNAAKPHRIRLSTCLVPLTEKEYTDAWDKEHYASHDLEPPPTKPHLKVVQ
jgi:hypothetical protein